MGISQLEKNNKTDARDVKMYNRLPPSGKGVEAELFAEPDVVQFTDPHDLGRQNLSRRTNVRGTIALGTRVIFEIFELGGNFGDWGIFRTSAWPDDWSFIRMI